MKYFLAFSGFMFTTLIACNQSPAKIETLQKHIDSLEKEVAKSYRPGFGEFMSGIQVHHAKLYYAGLNKNWELADFEIKEIEEAIEGIKQYCQNRPETKSIGMIDAPVDSIASAIQQMNASQFTKGYALLTNTCNSCHQVTNHAFNVIVVPASPPFSNQDFKAK